MSFKSRFVLKGDKKLIAALKRREGATFEAIKKVQNSTAREIIQESLQKVPKATFELARSARIQKEHGGRNLRTIAITYDTDYAMAVHQDLEAKHKPGQEAKFLEKPTKKRARQYASNIRAAVEAKLK